MLSTFPKVVGVVVGTDVVVELGAEVSNGAKLI